MIRVFLITSTQGARARLTELLEAAGAEVVGSAPETESVDEELVENADVILVDAGSEPLNALEGLQTSGLLHGSCVTLLTDDTIRSGQNQALRAGVRAVLPSNVSAGQLGVALEAVWHGLLVLHPGELRPPLSRESAVELTENVEALTAREREVLELLARGLGNKEIAGRLKISEHTAKFHVASILGKLGASSRTEAVTIGMRRGLLML